MFRTAFFAGLLTAATSLALCGSPASADDTVEMSLPMFQEPTHEVASVDREAKTAIVKPRQGRMFAFSVWEGLGVMMISSSGRPPFDTLVRIEVREVLEDGELLVAFGDGAAAAMRKGPAVLWRPFAGDLGDPQSLQPATTKQVRSLPDLLSSKNPQASAGLLGAVQAARAAARRMQSTNNLKQIALAFHNYSDVYRSFPPAVIYGPDGKPWHSWRVLLLPYLEQRALYEQYDFSQPWDAPANRKISETILPVYQDPSAEGEGAFTSYAAIVGENAIFAPNLVKMQSPDDFPKCLTSSKKMHFRDVTDGTSNTILFATLPPERSIPWAKPEDILLDDAFAGVGKPKGIGAIHPGPTPEQTIGLVGFTDGSVRTVLGDLDRETILPFLTRNGGEVVDSDALGTSPGKSTRQVQPLVRIFKSDDGVYGFSVDEE